MQQAGHKSIVVLGSCLIIISILITGCGSSPTAQPQPPNQVPPNYVSGNGTSTSFVNILVNSVQFTGSVSNFGSTGNLQFFVVVSDDSGHADALICPYDGVMRVQSGDTVNPCQAGITYPEELLQGNLYVMLIALDVKDKNDMADLATNAFTTGLGYGIEQAIKYAAAGAGVSVGGPWAIAGFLAMDTVIGYAGGKIEQYFQKNYVIGTQSFVLTRDHDWNNGQPITASSTNSQVNFTFNVQKSSTASGQVVYAAPVNDMATQPPASSSSFNSTSNSSKRALISCSDIFEVNIRKSPGYIGKDDDLDRVVKVPCGEYVDILDGPSYKDSLNWWHVSWNGYEGWMADHTGSGKLILDFNP